MNEMCNKPLVLVAKDGQKYLKWAYGRLQALTRIRQDMRLPTLHKQYQVGRSHIWIKSSAFGDIIRITGDVLQYLYAADVVLSITIDSEIIINTIDDFLSIETASVVFPDASKVPIPGGQGTISAHQFGGDAFSPAGTQIGNWVTWTNAPVSVAGTILSIQNGVSGILSNGDGTGTTVDTTVITEVDEESFINSLLFETSMTEESVSAIAEAGHPTFTPAPESVFANGEKITIVRLVYDFIRVDESVGSGGFVPAGATITGVTITSASKYSYSATTDTAPAEWIAKGPQTLKTASDTVLRSFSTDTYFGNTVFVSEDPWTKQGEPPVELETTYKAQMAALQEPAADPSVAPLTATKLLRAVQLVL